MDFTTTMMMMMMMMMIIIVKNIGRLLWGRGDGPYVFPTTRDFGQAGIAQSV